jgi:dinuclear metal center YbgI/SA1388 family protein
MDLNTFTALLDDFLQTSEFAQADVSLNGLQVARKNPEITRAAFAVDACMESFRGAAAAGADILIVHHGLFWGKPIAVTETHYSRLVFLLEHDLALYASHLPLDAHPQVGNNAGLAKALGLTGCEPFGEYHGKLIGLQGTLPHAMMLEEAAALLGLSEGPAVSILPFGPSPVSKVGVISGGAPGEVAEAIERKLDLYITGEPSHQVYHQCLEAGISMIAAGHYATEVYGPKLLAEWAAAETGVQTVFIDHPTGL